MTIQQLANAAAIATRERYEFQHMVDKIRRDRTDEFEKALRKELDAQYGERDTQLRDAEYHAKAALEKAKSEAAAAGVDAPYPLGTRFAEWKFNRWEDHGKEWKPTGRIAVLVAVTTENRYEMTKQLGCMASNRVGEFVLRLLKKDGTPGAVYTSVGAHGWCPEGEDRNTWKGVPTREREIEL